MITEIDDITNDNANAYAKAADFLASGEVIGFPTETVYGIGADIFNPEAVKKIFEAKDRPPVNPLAAHISDIRQAEELCRDIPDEFYLLAEKFLPGPLSIILWKRNIVDNIVTAGFDTLAIRLPNNSAALKLIDTFGNPLAATSGNLSGRPSPTTAMHVYEDLKGRIPYILDAGPCRYGIDSTVIRLTGSKPEILRTGAIPAQELESVINADININTLTDRKYKPHIPILITYSASEIYNTIAERPGQGRMMVLVSEPAKSLVQDLDYRIVYSSNFYSLLREAENNNYEILAILVDDIIKSDKALFNRIILASGDIK